MDHSTRNAPLVVATFLARYLTDKENGAVRTLQEYEELFPGYESVIKREWDQIQQDQPADSHGGVEERSLGKYVIEQELGRGGQGVVYRARDTELRRTVALKVLPAGLARTSEMRQRLFREAEAASRLDDPGICTVYEAGEHEGVAFIAMRLVEGESLAERLSRRRSGGEAPQSEALMLDTTPDPVPVRREPSVRSAPQRPDKDEIVEFVEIIADCAAILHRTHEAGLVHRDIKPGNVMISEDGSPVILDFGLARMEDHPDGSLTEAGDLLGTPAYMSPEQLRDHHRRVDRRTDVYSLAVTLYECLTLRRPFEAPTRERLYMQILDSEPTGASRWNPEIGKDLAVVVACALDMDRTRRYHTCAEFSEDLRRCLKGEPVTARPVSRTTRCLRWVRRHPTAASVIVLVIAATASFVLWQAATSRELQARSQRADALRRAMLAKDLSRTDIDAAIAEAAGAVKTLRSPQTWSSYYEVLASAARRTVLPITDGPALCKLDPAGTRVLVMDYNAHRIEVWNVKTLKRIRSVQLDRRPWGRPPVAFSSRTVAVALNDPDGESAVWVLDLVGSQDPVILEHPHPVGSLAFSTQGDQLVTGTAPLNPVPSALKAKVRVWDLAKGGDPEVLGPGFPAAVTVCRFVQWSGIVAVARSGFVQRWWLDSTGKRVPDKGSLIKPRGRSGPMFGPGPWSRAGCGADGSVILIDKKGARVSLRGGRQLPDPKHDERWSGGSNIDRCSVFTTGSWRGSPVALSGGFLADGGGLVVRPGPVRLWHLTNGRHLLTCGDPDDRVRAADFVSSETLATVQVDGSVSVWSEDGSLVSRAGGGGRGLWDAAISGPGRVAVMTTDRGLEVVRLPWDGELLAFTQDGRALIHSRDGSLALARPTATGPDIERSLAPDIERSLSPSLRRINRGTAAAGIKGHIAFANLDGVHIWQPDGSHALVKRRNNRALAFSPDGVVLAVAGAEGVVVLDVTSGRTVRSWPAVTIRNAPRLTFLSANRILVSSQWTLGPGSWVLELDAPADDAGEHLAVKILSVDEAGRTAVGLTGKAGDMRGSVVIVNLDTLQIRPVEKEVAGRVVASAAMSADGLRFAMAWTKRDERVQVIWYDTASLQQVGSRTLDVWGLCSPGAENLVRFSGKDELLYLDRTGGTLWLGLTMDRAPSAQVSVHPETRAYLGSWLPRDPTGRWLGIRSFGGVRFIPVDAEAHAAGRYR